MNFLKKIDEFLFSSSAKQYEHLLRSELVGACDSVLDLACGSSSPIRSFSRELKKVVGVDGFAPSIEKSKKQGIHHEYHLLNLNQIETSFQPQSFDAVIALDLIEHFEKKEGEKFLETMEKIAKKKVIIFTPNGFLPQDPYEGNAFQAHISGWKVEEMRKKGYRVYGLNGWKPLRGDLAEIQWKPRFLWKRISWLTQSFFLHRPKYAFQILCIKDLDSKSA